MNKGVAVGVLVCALAAGVAYLALHGRHGATPPATGDTQTNEASPSPANSVQKSAPRAVPQSGETSSPNPTAAAPVPNAATTQEHHSPLPYVLGSPDSIPAGFGASTIMENTRSAIRLFGSTFGGNPVGTNPEITAALNGGNPKQIKFISENAGLRINGEGALVDYWGTPFFFHQLSATDMEIRSAGPDKIMWTGDDQILK